MQVREIIVELAEKYNLQSIGVFGSRARGDFNQYSDYDIFIIGDINLDHELELEEELSNKIKIDVDLINLSKLDDKILIKNILNDAKVFLNKDESFEKLYNEIDKFFIENNDFLYRREVDLID